jgi:hypothetical protein
MPTCNGAPSCNGLGYCTFGSVSCKCTAQGPASLLRAATSLGKQMSRFPLPIALHSTILQLYTAHSCHVAHNYSRIPHFLPASLFLNKNHRYLFLSALHLPRFYFQIISERNKYRRSSDASSVCNSNTVPAFYNSEYIWAPHRSIISSQLVHCQCQGCHPEACVCKNRTLTTVFATTIIVHTLSGLPETWARHQWG